MTISRAGSALVASVICVGALVAGASSHAQSDKITKLILPVAAGSGVDTIVRASSKALGAALGAAVVIDNQPGAGGIVGTAAMVKSPPDGSTLSVVSNNHVIFPSVYKSLPFDPISDITPIAVMGTSPMVLVVNPKVPAKDAKELVALLKANPDSLNYASSGNGTILHLAAEMFLDEAGVKARHIPYKGVGPMITDLLGGQVDFGVLALPSIQAHLKSGALRAIGTSSKARLGAAPGRRLVRRHWAQKLASRRCETNPRRVQCRVCVA
jgi:tripartite-type tricarboxylate transporter receptor subunit TctC